MERPRGERRAAAAASLLFLSVSFLLYQPALGLGFLSDDWYFIRAGIVRSWPALLLPPRDVADPQSYHYVPVGQVAYVLEHAVFGLAPRPWHGVNLILHALNAFLLFRLCRSGL